MIGRYHPLSAHPAVFRALTGLSVAQFDALYSAVAPRLADAERRRLSRPERRRAIGAGRRFALADRDRLLLTVVWLRRYPINAVLGFLFGVGETTALRAVHRLLPLLEAAGLDTMRLPDPGKGRRPDLDALLRDTPGLAVVLDTFEQRVQRPKGAHVDGTRVADAYYSGKKKQHTLKTQVGVARPTGEILDVPESVPGPTHDRKLPARSGALAQVPDGVGATGDLGYVGMDKLAPAGLPTATPRRKPRKQPRPPEDLAYNTAFARERVVVEHRIGRMRHYQAITQPDRHHRQHHTPRTRAIASLANRQLRHRRHRCALCRP
jgi:hypothetical protein